MEWSKERVIRLRNKVKETDAARKKAINDYKRALYAYDLTDEEVVIAEEKTRRGFDKKLRRREK